ncbi:MAG: VCBS repeat-containing protein, partial [Myxococcales bacterium]|nr:VCBS repeat-containing protein [Myxococcales bacterium]
MTRGLATAALLSLALGGASCTQPADRVDEASARPEITPTPAASATPRPDAAADDEDAKGHARMVAALADEARAAIERAPYVGESRANQLREQLARHGARMDPVSRTRTRYQLAAAELELGREREAIALFETARDELVTLGDAVPSGPAAELRFQLGVAYLRLGESQNCCLRNNADSCILPIAGGGVHADEEGARKAMAVFIEVARDAGTGERLRKKAIWLLNVAAMTVAAHPAGVPEDLRIPAAAFQGSGAASSFPRFVNVSRELGVDRESLAGGAVIDDFDGDGLLDIIVTDWFPDRPPALWRNRGDGSFESKLEGSGLEGVTGGLNLVHADYDNDGDL